MHCAAFISSRLLGGVSGDTRQRPQRDPAQRQPRTETQHSRVDGDEESTVTADGHRYGAGKSPFHQASLFFRSRRGAVRKKDNRLPPTHNFFF
jgi:hypothetical protein